METKFHYPASAKWMPNPQTAICSWQGNQVLRDQTFTRKRTLKRPASFCSQLLLLLHSAFLGLGRWPPLLRSPAHSFWFREKGMPNSRTGEETERLRSWIHYSGLWRNETITENRRLIHSRFAFRKEFMKNTMATWKLWEGCHFFIKAVLSYM